MVVASYCLGDAHSDDDDLVTGFGKPATRTNFPVREKITRAQRHGLHWRLAAEQMAFDDAADRMRRDDMNLLDQRRLRRWRDKA